MGVFAQTHFMNKKVGSWWVFQSPSDIEVLRPLAKHLDVVSFVCHEYPDEISPGFFEECKSFGWEINLLVGRCHGNYETPEEAKKTVASLMKRCRTLGFDGLDFDYEFEPPQTRDAYSNLLRIAKEELHGEGKTLSICVGFHPPAQQRVPDHGFIDPVVIGEVCDEVRVMCYDQYHAPAKGKVALDRLDCQGIGPASSQPWAEAAMKHWSRYVSVEKLTMGLPAYGNDYDARYGGGGRSIYTTTPPVNIFADKTWLHYEKLHLYRYMDENNSPRIFYASDAESTAALLDTADGLNIPSVCFWQGRSVEPAMWAQTDRWRAQSVAK